MQKFLVLLTILISVVAFSQDVIVNNGELAEAEFHTAINPLDSNNMVIATIHGYNNLIDGFDLTIYYTNDFGETWNESDFNGVLPDDDFSGDAVLSFNENGKVMLVNLSAVDDFTTLRSIISESNDGGATWTIMNTIVDGFTDKPWLAVDNFIGSPYNGNIYVPQVGFNVALYALNSDYEIISNISIPEGDQLPSVVVRKDGKVFTSTVGLGDPNVIYVQEFDNAGSEVVHSTNVVSFPDYTFNAPTISLRFQPTAYLAIDNSGSEYDGRLYLSYTASEVLDDTFFNVFLTYSDDNGLTWSDPSIVHSDTSNDIQQFYSSIYVNDEGVVIMDWYDRKNFENTNTFTDFMLGISHDGGESFEEVQLNTESTDFDFVVPSSSNFGIGEYHQVVATNHTAISFWCDGRTNDEDLNIYMAKVSIDNITGIQEQSVVSSDISISNLYPLPNTGSTFTNISLKKKQNLKYEIISANGDLIRTSNWNIYPEGNHTLEIKINESPGVYLVKILNDSGYFKTMKLLIE